MAHIFNIIDARAQAHYTLFKTTIQRTPPAIFIFPSSRMSDSVGEQVSVFCSLLRNGRFDDATLQILESTLVSKDVKSLMELTSNLRDFLRSECVFVIREISQKSVEQKLLIIDFFVHAFALAGDVESCFAMRYEALIFREFNSMNHQWLQVSYTEWLQFAEHLLEAGFNSIAGTACENALLCIHRNDTADSRKGNSLENVHAIEKVKKLKNRVVTSASSHSVQALGAEYLKKKIIGRSKKESSSCDETKCIASTLFRNGIKNRNAQKLREHQSSNRSIDGSNSGRFLW